MFANNPALCAYVEACKFPFQPSPDDIMILSLGTGSKGKTYPYESSKRWGKVRWVVPVIDIYGSAGSQTVDHQLKVLYRCQHIRDQYFRIEPDLSQFDVSPLMDNVSTKNIKALEAVGEKMVEETIKAIKETENEADEIIRKADATCTEILEKAAREAKEIKEQAVANAKKQAETELFQVKEEGETLKKKACEKTEQETEALKALAQGKEEEAVSAVMKALL